ncbi:hypothetical protein [Parvibaculum sp.]|uniref:hypothetical protein n=1 Tax=Parvibaculum sp. TaxID=2024848 RepID=UPI003BA8DE91
MQKKVIRGVALLDMAVTLPFALPFIAEIMILIISELDRWLGFYTPSGQFDIGPLAMMFVHIMGVLGVIWALARLHMVSLYLARMDAVARLAVAALIVSAIAQGATPVLWLFVLTEIGGSAAQFSVLRRKVISPPAAHQ